MYIVHNLGKRFGYKIKVHRSVAQVHNVACRLYCEFRSIQLIYSPRRWRSWNINIKGYDRSEASLSYDSLYSVFPAKLL